MSHRVPLSDVEQGVRWAHVGHLSDARNVNVCQQV
jgi:hypothetical protein